MMKIISGRFLKSYMTDHHRPSTGDNIKIVMFNLL